MLQYVFQFCHRISDTLSNEQMKLFDGLVNKVNQINDCIKTITSLCQGLEYFYASAKNHTACGSSKNDHQNCLEPQINFFCLSSVVISVAIKMQEQRASTFAGL